MATIVRGKNLEITPALKDHVEKQEKKVTKYFDNEVNVQALLSVEKDRKIAEITLKVDGVVLRALVEGPAVPEENFEVARVKKFAARPMDVEEAILQMNLVGHDFFVFLNSKTDTINVVYKRKHGKYGLIEPEY